MGSLMCAVLLCGSIPVYADELTVSEGTITQAVESGFVVEESNDGEGLIVSIPANLTLTYDEDAGMYICHDEVSARGIIDINKQLEISVAETVTYINVDSPSTTVVGAVDFGADGTEVWTADEIAASNDNLDSRDITVSVSKENLKYSGTYTSELVFNIELIDVTP